MKEKPADLKPKALTDRATTEPSENSSIRRSEAPLRSTETAFNGSGFLFGADSLKLKLEENKKSQKPRGRAIVTKVPGKKLMNAETNQNKRPPSGPAVNPSVLQKILKGRDGTQSKKGECSSERKKDEKSRGESQLKGQKQEGSRNKQEGPISGIKIVRKKI
jgi:hypothetical protein